MATTKDVPPRRDGSAPRAAPVPYASADTGGSRPPPRRGRLVGLIVGTVVSTALVMATFIWYRSHTVNEPTTAVIVEGSPAFDGTVVTVTGARTFTVRLSEANNYVATVLLEPGYYRVKAQREDRVLRELEVPVERYLGVRIRLTDGALDSRGATPATTRPSRADNP